jgi:7-cyano-7-deazaguanine synthase in queuosine biosynthesis
LIKKIDCCGTNLDIYDGPVGIMVSGGVDSAILLYYLMKHSKDKIHIFSYNSPRFNVTNHRVNISVAIQVVEACIKLTDNTNIEHHISYCKNLFVMPKQFIEEKRIKIVYGGVTSIPPKKVLDTFKLRSLELDNRDPNVERDVLSSDGIWYAPWTNIDKKIIASMYKEENLIETLFSITRSCAYEPTLHWFRDHAKDPGLGHCGICWWCEEREWAFGRLQ